MKKYTVIESRANAGNFHLRVSEPIIDLEIGDFPIGENLGFSIAMTQEQAEKALLAAVAGKVSFNLVGEPNDAGFYNVEVVIPSRETAVAPEGAAATRTLVHEA